MPKLRGARETLQRVRTGLRELAFPHVCSICGSHIGSGAAYVCLRCRATLTTLDLHTLAENEITDRFWARLPVARGAALLPYRKGTPAEKVMQALKYDNRPDIGLSLGAWLGMLLAGSVVFGEVDAIIPVPLHPQRQRMRGYNQAERIGAGLSRTLDAPCLDEAVRRTRHTQSQTTMSQFERMQNMEGVFELANARSLRGRHVLLVDDVLTTGATLEAVGREVLKAEPASIKIATLALARK